MTEYKQLCNEAVEMRKRAEFAPASWENLGIKIASMYTETVELELALEGQSSDLVAKELADISLYVLSALGDLGEEWNLRSPRPDRIKYASPETLTKPIRFAIRQVYEYWRRDKRRDTIIALELVLKRCIELSEVLGIYLPAIIRLKIDINNQRPACHGGKNPNT